MSNPIFRVVPVEVDADPKQQAQLLADQLNTQFSDNYAYENTITIKDQVYLVVRKQPGW